MSEEGDLFLNLATGYTNKASKQKLSKKERRYKKRLERREEDTLLEKLRSLKHFSDKTIQLAVKAKGDTADSSKEELPKAKPAEKRKRKYEGQQDENPAKKYTNALFYNNPEIPKLSKTRVEEVKEAVFSDDCFDQLNLHPFMVSNLEQKLHMAQATAVQKAVIPEMLKGNDVLVKSQTGSGKTLAYAIPIVQHLQGLKPKITRSDGILALVIVPTRELALQSFDTFQKLVRPFTWVVPGCLMGGEKKKAEKARLRKGLNIIVATPGRLIDHIKNTKNIRLHKVLWLVIDEADRLLDMGFEREVREIISVLNEQSPKERKTALLSATLTEGVERLAGMSLSSPVKIDMSADQSSSKRDELITDKIAVPENLKHHCVIVPSKLRLVTLAAFILWKCKLAAKRSKILVFMSTQDTVDFHHRLFSNTLLEEDDKQSANLLYSLHGDMPQKERTEVFNKFARVESGVLFCTDVAARGLDLPQVRWIIQYMPPGGSTDYIHRVGRTARIGSRGNALLFLTPAEAPYTELLADCGINLIEVQMNHILQTLLVGFDRLEFIYDENDPPQTIQEAASSLQAKFIDFVRIDKETRTLARKAFQSFIGAYAAYPSSVKRIFHMKNLHLGHVATSFGLQEAPTKIGTIVGKQGRLSGGTNEKKRKSFQKGPLASSMHRSNASEFSSGLDFGISTKVKFTRKEQKKLFPKKVHH